MNDLFRLSFDRSPIAIFVIDTEGVIIEINSTLSAMYGVSREQAIGKKCHEAFNKQSIPCEITPERKCSWKAVLQTGEVVEGERTHPASKDGLVLCVKSRAVPFKNAKGDVEYIIIYVQDMTEQKLIASELKAMRDSVKILKGLLPICASCKKIRDEKGGWNQIEVYIRDHSEANFTHGLCPECVKEWFPSQNGQ